MRHRVNAARVAIRNQTAFFTQQHGHVISEWKADDTRVTFADFAISEKIPGELRKDFPEDQFFSEESVFIDEEVPLTSRYAWVLDPIDGTNNYALGMPSCAISLALLKQGQPLYGLVYDGSTRELIEGGPGFSLLINGKKHLHPGRPFEARTSIVGLHFPLPAGRAGQLRELMESYRIRSLGSAALHLTYVALGRLDGSLDEKVRLWDVAAAHALIQSAGLGIEYLDGSPFPVVSFGMGEGHLRYLAGSPGFLAAMQNWLG